MIRKLILIVALISQFFLISEALSLQWPSPSSTVTSGYGVRIHPKKKIPTWHNGVDMSTGGSSKLKAVVSGAIEHIRTGGISGNRIKAGGWQYLHLAISMSPAWEFGQAKGWDGIGYSISVYYLGIQLGSEPVYYSTNSKIQIDRGNGIIEESDARTSVTESDFIAYSGNTGSGTGVHLHLIQHSGNSTKSPLIDLYNAKTGDADGYNPPKNASNPTVTDLTYDNVTGIIAGKTDATSERDINKFKLSISDGTDYEVSFYKRKNASDNDITYVTKTGILPLDDSAQKHLVHYAWTPQQQGGRCRGASGNYNVTFTAFDAIDRKGELSISLPPLPSPNYPGCDNPDDNYSVSDPTDLPPDEDFTGDPIWITPRVGILKDGFVPETGDLLTQKKLRYTFKSVDVSSFDLAAMDLIVIPSGGLHAVWNSDFFKKGIEDYVKAGGKVIVFSQQHGYEYSALPTPDGKPISAFGWAEDQSCQYRSSYIDTWSQMLSSISQSKPSINVDGYFTSYPDTSTVLLRRTANGQPAAIMYPYGQGYVIATTFYTDVASGMSQASAEEKALIRDIITWAQKPLTLPEINPGQTVSVPLIVKNTSTTDAASVKVSIYDPDRKTAVNEEVFPVPVAAGASAELTVDHAATALGIYHVDYSLLDAQNEPIWPRVEMDAARFAVSNPPGNPDKSPDFSFAINSDSERYAYGSDAVCTVTMWNNTDADRSIAASACTRDLTVPGVPNCGGGVYGPPTITMVPAHSAASFQLTATNVTIWQSWLIIRFSDEAGKQVGWSQRGIWMYYPAVAVSAAMNKTVYTKGEPVNLTVDLQNKQSIGYTTALKLRVADQANTGIYTAAFDIALPASGASAQSVSFVLPSTAQDGFYTVSAEAFDTMGNKTGGDSTSFEVHRNRIAVTPNLPSAFNTGTNTIPFVINNTGKINVQSGSLDIILKDPAGAVAYSASQPFTIAAGENKTIDVSVSIPPLKFGSYTLTYSNSDETGIGRPATISIANAVALALSGDKTFYRLRDTANLTLSLTNTGQFDQDNISVMVSVPDAGYTDTRNLSLGINPNATALNYAIPIPATILPGQHDANVTLTLPSGSSFVQSVKLTVPESSLTLGYSGPTAVTAGDTIQLTIENAGGVDTSYAAEKLLLKDSMGTVLYQNSAAGTIPAGERKALIDIQIPAQVVSHAVYLYAAAKDTKTGKVNTFNTTLDVSGLFAGLTVRTDKEAYLDTEPITALAQLTNAGPAIDSGTLAIKIIKYPDSATGTFTHFLPDPKLWSFDLWFFKRPNSVAVAADGSVYVADTAMNRIQKFDRHGGLIQRWGEYCQTDTDGDSRADQSCEGNFYGPEGIAAAPDGSVYVTDTLNHRIQKFSREGVFIAQWGGYCFTDYNFDGKIDEPCIGKFTDPSGIAVAADGTVYVVDHGNSRVQKFGPDGVFLAQWGQNGVSNGQFDFPDGIALAPDGSVYVADYGNHRVQKFSSNGTFITKWGSRCAIYTNSDDIPDQQCAGGLFNNPTGITVSAGGFVYVSDSFNHRIQKFDGEGNFITTWGAFCETYIIWSTAPGVYQTCNGQFNHPNGLSAAPDGTVYVADTNNDSIQIFNAEGGYVAKWGTLGSGDGQFAGPKKMAMSPDGFLYIADGVNRIQKFDAVGNLVSVWGGYCKTDTNRDNIPDRPCPGEFNFFEGIAVDADGFVYVADTGNHRIQKFNRSGEFVSQWGAYCQTDFNRDGVQEKECNGMFYKPEGVAVAPDGSLYVVDAGNSRIQKFDSSGIFLDKWGRYAYGGGKGTFNYPRGIAVSGDGSVYVVDNRSGLVQKFTSDGTFILQWGGFGAGEGEFWYPNGGIDVAPDGSVYIVDSGNDRIQLFDGSGTFIAKWGSFCKADSDGDRTFDQVCEGRFNQPEGIAVTAEGHVFVADTQNHRIQRMRVTAGGAAETLFTALLPVNQPAHIPQDYTTAVHTLKARGKLYVQGELKNKLGQSIAKTEYPFYLVEGNTVLLLNTDKKVYKPGEAVTISGAVRNLANIEAVNLKSEVRSQKSNGTAQTLYTETISIPAGGSHPFTATTTADGEGVVALTGAVTQNASTLVEIADQYEVATPKVTASVSMPDTAGNDPFNINVELKNEGKVDATTRVQITDSRGQTIDDKNITISAGETKLLPYAQQIPTTTNYAFMFTGDVNQAIIKSVIYGLAARISIGSGDQGQGSGVYTEGKIAIPVTVVNIGQLDAGMEVSFQLSSQQSVVSSQNKTYYIPKGGSISDTLYYDLAEGSYQLIAGSKNPAAGGQANLSVLKENKVDMAVTVGSGAPGQGVGVIPVSVNITNRGYKVIEGSTQLSVVSSQGTIVWSGEQAVSQLATNNSQLVTFNINPAAITPGEYPITAELLNNSRQQLAIRSAEFGVQSASFRITQLPPYQIFAAGQEGTFTFKVKNTGNQEGGVDFTLKAYDVVNAARTGWLKPGEEKDISFSFLLPGDLEEKDYFADYTLTPALSQGGEGWGVKGQVKYHLAGINLAVNASLDKQYYAAGDTARLTLVVSRQSTVGSQNLFARINYGSYEEQRPFTMTGSETLAFDIPLTQITGEKVFYGIYYEGGRSIHLNSLYVYQAGDALTITTDKQVYGPGETITAWVRGQGSGVQGTMTLTGPNYSETFVFNGTAVKNFTLPSTMTAGTYAINSHLAAADNQTYTAAHAIDVNGIQVKILEARINKAKYAETDTIAATLTITSNTDLSGMLKTWIVDPRGTYTSAGEKSINLSSSENLLLTADFSLLTSVSGIHRLVYGVYATGSAGSGEMLLSSGSEAFDVGNAVLLGLSTDKNDYGANTEPISAKASIYGAADATLELLLDGTPIKTESTSLNGFTTLALDLGTVTPGTHALKGVLTTGGLTSVKETAFVYGSNLPDLTAWVEGQGSGVQRDNTLTLAVTVVNQGKDPSSATTVSVYDGDSLIATKPVKALNNGESDTIIVTWNVLGKAGEHIIKAVVDQNNSVTELNEQNNTAVANIRVPDIAVTIETDKDTYKIRQKVYVTSTLANLTTTKTYNNLTITTSAKDVSGSEVYTKTTALGVLGPLNSTTNTEAWSSTGLTVDGTYTVTRTVLSGTQLVAQNSKRITLLQAPDFTLSTDANSRRVKQGEKAAYTVSLEPFNGWDREVTLSMEGLPSGATASFSPDRLIPPGQSVTVVITTETTTTGTHTLYLNAQGVDVGEIVTHTIPLTLEVSGFGLEATVSTQTIKQLETATFAISITSQNGYTGNVNLSAEGMPAGVRASFDTLKPQAPGTATMTIQTSKYAKPGTYTLTVAGKDGWVSHSMNLTLVIQPNPDIAMGIIVTPGPGAKNPATVSIFSKERKLIREFRAFDTMYGANAATADIDGDGYDEIIVAPGPDSKARGTIKVFRKDGSLMFEQKIFNTMYGLTLASADFDGDWKDEIIVGTGRGPKNPSRIKILHYDGTRFVDTGIDMRAFGRREKEEKEDHGEEEQTYGVDVAAGDVDGDNGPELITATAPGSGPESPSMVKVFTIDASAGIGNWNVSGTYSEFTAFKEHEARGHDDRESDDEPADYGPTLAAGDIDADGVAEIIVGAGPDPKNKPVFKVFRGDGTFTGMEVNAYPDVKNHHEKDSKEDRDEDGEQGRYRYGVNVAAGDMDGDGKDEIITGLGPGPRNESLVKIFKSDGAETGNFLAYPVEMDYGVKVSIGRTGR
jgi:hypothetical protein